MAQWQQTQLLSVRLQVDPWSCSVHCVAVNCGVVDRQGSDLVWLWLWHRPAAAAPFLTPSLGTSMCLGCSPRKKDSY